MSRSDSLKVLLSREEKRLAQEVANARGTSMAAAFRDGIKILAERTDRNPAGHNAPDSEQGEDAGEATPEAGGTGDPGGRSPDPDDLRDKLGGEGPEGRGEGTDEGGAGDERGALSRFLYGSEPHD